MADWMDAIIPGLSEGGGAGTDVPVPTSSFNIPSGGFNFGGGSESFQIPSAGLNLGSPNVGSVPSLPGAPFGNLDVLPSGGGLDDILGGVGKAFTSDPLSALAKTLGIGTAGMGAYATVKGMQQGAQQSRLMRQEERRQQGIAAPAATAGAELTSAGTEALLGGPLPPQLEQMVEKFRDETRARLQSYFAKAGITDSTMMEEMNSWVDQQVGTYREQLAQQLLQSGYQGVGVALAPSSAVGGTAERQMGGTADFLKSAQTSINLLTGSQG